MRTFLIVLAVSTLTSIMFWNFGLAARIWPAHPLLCTTVLAWACAVTAQALLTAEAKREKDPKR
jgi:hypothetical protein